MQKKHKMYSFPNLGVTVAGAKDEEDARRIAELGLDGCLEVGYDPRPGMRHKSKGSEER